jgi:hypothetical protein
MNGAAGLAALRRFSRAPSDPAETCDGCRAPLAVVHEHRLYVGATTGDRRLECVCTACASADESGGPWKRVRNRCVLARGLDVADVEWDALGVPIRLAFFVVTEDGGRPLAFFPSPAGPTELKPDLGTWSRMRAKSAAVQRMRADVEALLVHHARPAHDGGPPACDQYVVSIDVCYRLVGIMMAHWRGFSGGAEVWKRIEALFAELRREATDA